MVGSFAEQATSLGLSTMNYLLIGGAILIVVAVAIGASFFFYKRKKWNLQGTAVLLRNNLNEQFEDKCKGYWDAENGWIVVKRKGYRPVHTRPFDPKIWLVGRNKFTVVQTGPEEYVIARVDWSQVIDSETGKVTPVAKVIADIGKRKTWKNYTERMGKKTFTLRGYLDAHQTAITLVIVMIGMCIGFAILWTRQGSVCGA